MVIGLGIRHTETNRHDVEERGFTHCLAFPGKIRADRKAKLIHSRREGIIAEQWTVRAPVVIRPGLNQADPVFPQFKGQAGGGTAVSRVENVG